MADKLTDKSIMTFGKYKGKPLGEIPDEYLLFLYNGGKTFGAFKAYLEDNIEAIKENLK